MSTPDPNTPRRFRYTSQWLDMTRCGIYDPIENCHIGMGDSGPTTGEPLPEDYNDFQWIDPSPSAEADPAPGIMEIVARLEVLEAWIKAWEGPFPTSAPIGYTGATTDPKRLDAIEQLNVRQERELDRLRGICRACAAMQFVANGLSYTWLMTIL